MLYVINFANGPFRKAQVLNTRTAYKYGADKVIEYSPNDIDDEFKKENEKIFSCKRGCGLWLWKPYFINKALSTVEYGDYVFYSDAGSYYVRDIYTMIKVMTDDIFVTDTCWLEKQFTKEDVFQKLGCTDNWYRESNQIQGGFVCVKKTEKSVGFVKKWLDYCCDYNLISPSEGNDKFPNCKDFVSHREDQSILSLLCKKEGIKTHLDPTQWGIIYRYPPMLTDNKYIYKRADHINEYPVCIALHRNDLSIKNRIKLFVNSYFPVWVSIMLRRMTYLKLRLKGEL
jgi:hypothetical protein